MSSSRSDDVTKGRAQEKNDYLSGFFCEGGGGYPLSMKIVIFSCNAAQEVTKSLSLCVCVCVGSHF